MFLYLFITYKYMDSLQYVITYVSSGHPPWEILPHTHCSMCSHMCLQVTTSQKSCSALLVGKWPFSNVCSNMYLQVTDL